LSKNNNQSLTRTDDIIGVNFSVSSNVSDYLLDNKKIQWNWNARQHQS